VKIFYSDGMRVRDSGLELEQYLPMKGVLKRKVVCGNDASFYLFISDSPIMITSCLQTHFLIKNSDADRSLNSKTSVLAEIYGLSKNADISSSVFEKNKAKKLHLIRCKGLSKRDAKNEES